MMKKVTTPLSKIAILALISGLTFLGCNAANDSGTQSEVTLQFATSNSGGPAKAIAKSKMAGDTLRVEGSNGTLVISDLRFIVEDFELERADVNCEEVEGTDEDECEEFESDPIFVDLPLQGDTLSLNTTPIDPGLYTKLDFEVDDLELDEEDAEDQNVKQQLIELVRTEFPDWPDSVSMVVIGEFVSAQGDSTPFKVYVEAEIEIELEFNPPLEVTDNAISKLVRVHIDPVAWFQKTDGTVWNLSEFDFEATGQTLEFEVEMEHGFDGIEHDDDHEDD